MITQLRRAFSSAASGRFNLSSSFTNLKSMLSTPLRHLKRFSAPSGSNYSPQLNTTADAFEEVAHEWQSLLVSNPYDVNIFNYLEAVAQTNFGTVDNPHVVFTSDAPFRYVGCTGQPNEDDYEGHEFMLFMLREGPLQRCPGCGQVFKLVRLRDEYTPEMDYYSSGFLPYEIQEMSEFDTPIIMNPLKMTTHHEYTQFESPSGYVYSLVNNDDHDRILTDPAYRMAKTHKSEEIFKVYAQSLKQLDQQYNETYGIVPNYPMNPVDYTTLLETEKAIMKLDRVLKKALKFDSRKFIDPVNHDRREARMNAQAKKRWEKTMAFYYGELTEEEQKYRDYFATDLEKFPENEKQEQQLDEEALLSREDYRLKNFDFQEAYTNMPEDDQGTLLERKVFQYKYRRAGDSSEVFERRNAKMIENHRKRFADPTFASEFTELRRKVTKNPSDYAAADEYKALLKKEAIAQFKDYYYDESNRDFAFLEGLAGEQEAKFLTVFENHCVDDEPSGFVTIPKRDWNKSLGMWMNFYLDLKEAAVDLRPKMHQVLEEAEETGQTLHIIGEEEQKVKEINMNIQKELDKDGVSGALYHLLWIKNEAFSEKLQLNIPDTVIYFNGKPIFWYYSTSEGLKKRKKEKVANGNILAYFQKIDPGIGVSAVFLHNEQPKSGPKKIVCRYMDLKQLGEFLEDENKPKEGILQRFVLPFGLNNCMIQVVWGNKVVLFSKRINKRNVYDKKLDIYERCCTFDGADHYSENVPVKGHLSQFLKTEIQKIVHHIASISYDKFQISRMLLFIKEDSKGKIWILWCNSIRVEGSTKIPKSLNYHMKNRPLDLATNISLPPNVDNFFSTDTLHPCDLQKTIHCLRCNQSQNSSNFLFVPYKLLVREHSHKIRKEDEFFTLMRAYALNPIEVRNANEEENEILRNLRKANLFYIKSDNDKIPVLLRRLHPRLNNREYMEIKDLMEFQEHKILICQNCYMELIQYLDFAGGEEFLLESIKGHAKDQKHGSTDLTIKRLEELKKPFYKEKRRMVGDLKSVCSYFRQKRCGSEYTAGNGGLREDMGKTASFAQQKNSNNYMESRGINESKSSENQFKLSENESKSKLNPFNPNETRSKLFGTPETETKIGENSSKNTERTSNFDKEVEELLNKYAASPKQEPSSAFKRLERKILPKVMKQKNHSLHKFHNSKASFDSMTTNLTSIHENH